MVLQKIAAQTIIYLNFLKQLNLVPEEPPNYSNIFWCQEILWPSMYDGLLFKLTLMGL